MRKRYTGGWYRAVQTTQEKRKSENCEYVRAKRSKANLPDTYDDYRNTSWNLRKSWKEKRKTQYREKSRGQKHQMFFKSVFEYSDLKNYLEKHDIPHRVETIRESYEVERVSTGYWTTKLIWGSSKVWFEHEFIEYDEPIIYTRKYSKTLGYEVTWWSDKDIGVEYIIK